MPSSLLATRPMSHPRWLPPEVWPWDIVAIEIDRSSIAVSEAGRGPAVLFYTGIGSFIWRDVIMRLSKDFRCVVLDPPGIGSSAPIPRVEATLRRSASAVAGVIEAFELSDLTLVVHDTGGPPAFAAAARRPEHIRGIVAVNTFGWRPTGAAFRGLLTVMGSPATRQLSVTTGALARVTATAFGAGRRLDPRSRRAFRAGFQNSMRVFHDYLRDARDSDLYEEIASGFAGPLRRLPLLTIFGERNDPLDFQPRWKTLFPDARQIVIPKGNHFPMCDDPDRVADEIRRWHREYVADSPEERS